jgi:hypothetical protein
VGERVEDGKRKEKEGLVEREMSKSKPEPGIYGPRTEVSQRGIYSIGCALRN